MKNHETLLISFIPCNNNVIICIQYIRDISELIRRIEAGNGYETTPISGNPILDTHYKYGTATITWSRMAEKMYLNSLKE